MAKQHYFFKLIPPRPAFPHDMNDNERRLMDEHGRNFQEHFAAGRFCSVPSWQAVGLSVWAFLRSIASRRLATSQRATHPLGRGLNRFEIH
jgi:hypothetical protein